jgi:hypothetical protein
MISVLFFIVAIVGAAVQLVVQKRERTPERIVEVLLLWILVVPIGVGSIFSALAHLFYPEQVAASIGWQTSPFQRENAFGDLGYGVLGVLCIWMRGKFWEATVIMSSISLLGDAYGHIYEMVVNNNHSPNNTGALLVMDIVIPIVAIVLLLLLRAMQRRRWTSAGNGLSDSLVAASQQRTQ